MSTTFLFENRLELAADLLGALANEKRFAILEIISRDETSVGSLALQVDLSQSALSQHLGKLRESKLVKTRRDAQTIFYRCDAIEVRRILSTLDDIFRSSRAAEEPG